MCLAVPLKLVEILKDRNEGRVDMAGSSITVSLDLVPEAMPGDYVLVHAGMAIEVMKEAEAKETLDIYLEYARFSSLLEPKAETTND